MDNYDDRIFAKSLNSSPKKSLSVYNHPILRQICTHKRILEIIWHFPDTSMYDRTIVSSIVSGAVNTLSPTLTGLLIILHNG